MMSFLNENAIYVVLTCALVIWLGIAGYLWRIDNRIRAIETMNKK